MVLAAGDHPDGYLEIRDRIKDVILSGRENTSSVEVEVEVEGAILNGDFLTTITARAAGRRDRAIRGRAGDGCRRRRCRASAVAGSRDCGHRKRARLLIAVRAPQRKGGIMAEGTIKRLTDKGFGFIETGTGKDLFFHMSAVEGVRFEDLRQGQRVSFNEGQGPKGPRAENVKVI
jgi:CspA family cold shock protein